MCDIRKTIDDLRERLDELEDYLCISEEEVYEGYSERLDEEYDDDCCPHCGEPLEDDEDEDDDEDDYEYPLVNVFVRPPCMPRWYSYSYRWPRIG